MHNQKLEEGKVETDKIIHQKKGNKKNPEHAFSKFKELTKKSGISQEIEDAGNVTIFSPMNRDFDKLNLKFDDVDLKTLRKWMLKHFVKGFLFRKDMEFGKVPVSTLIIRQLLRLFNSVGRNTLSHGAIFM